MDVVRITQFAFQFAGLILFILACAARSARLDMVLSGASGICFSIGLSILVLGGMHG